MGWTVLSEIIAPTSPRSETMLCWKLPVSYTRGPWRRLCPGPGSVALWGKGRQ